MSASCVCVCGGVMLREREGEYACVVNDETDTQYYVDSLLHECSGPQYSCEICSQFLPNNSY